jgi:flagellar basal-body rod protein FlgF
LTVWWSPGNGDILECGGFFLLIRGLYASAAGALVAEAMIDNVSNNLANSSTNGFKRTLLQIESQPQSELYRFQTDAGQNPLNRLPGVDVQVPIGPLGSGSDVYATPTNYEQGQIAMNGNTYSFALSGPGFFAVQDRNSGQITYTRNGAFMRSADGTLTTVDGSAVLDGGGHSIPMPALGKIEVDTKGNINVDGVTSGQIGTFEFNNLNALQPQGATGFTAGPNAGLRPATRTSVLQYSEEKSNGDVIRSMVDLISAERWFQANEKSIATQDDATNQAISTVGKTS